MPKAVSVESVMNGREKGIDNSAFAACSVWRYACNRKKVYGYGWEP